MDARPMTDHDAGREAMRHCLRRLALPADSVSVNGLLRDNGHLLWLAALAELCRQNKARPQ